MFDDPVSKIMRKRKLLTAVPGTSVARAAMRMAARNVGAILVVEEDRLLGILTERDIVFRVVCKGLDPRTTRLAEVWHSRAANATLDLFDRERRLVTLEYIDQQSTQNKRNLESDGVALKTNLEAIAADPLLMREYLMRVSMIASLARAKELGATQP